MNQRYREAVKEGFAGSPADWQVEILVAAGIDIAVAMRLVENWDQASR
jgi:hypothetical protein